MQILKIDRSFIRDLPDSSEDGAICKAVISLAHSLGLEVVAEGVETDEQLEFLRDHGCDQIQGFLLGRPVPEADFVKLLSEQNSSASGRARAATASV